MIISDRDANFYNFSVNKNSDINNYDNEINRYNILYSILKIDEISEKINTRNKDRIDEEIFCILKGHITNLITSQNGSRILQKLLKKTSKDILSLILEEIIEKIPDLLVDCYANYFCQKFFFVLKKEDRILFLEKIEPHFLSISQSKIGTYPLQAMMEHITDREEKKVIINAIIENILDFCYVKFINFIYF
jgi:hypothetical protein